MATALVTGGTSGIGAAFARHLAARGMDLVLVARDSSRLESAAAELSRRYGVVVETITADLAVRSDVQRVADRLSDRERPIETLVNNAGFGVHTALVAVDTAPHERALDVMCRAVLVLGAAAGRAMSERGRGTILNVSSVAGLFTMGSYSAIKAWVASYSEGLAVELRGSGVVVTTLLPGWVATEFHDRAGIRTGSIPKSLWLDVETLVAAALRDVDRRRVVSIPSFRYRVLSWFGRHLPRSTNRWVSGKISSSRSDSAAPGADSAPTAHPGDGSEHPPVTTGSPR